MNQNIAQYIRENKNKSTQEDLVKSLRQAGYPEDEIQEAIAFGVSEDAVKEVTSESSIQKNSLTGEQLKMVDRAKMVVSFTTFFSFFLFPLVAIPANIIGVIVYARLLNDIPGASDAVMKVMLKMYLVVGLIIAAFFGACLLIFSTM